MSSTQPDGMDADYLETFSLRCEPFADDNDGRFFYAGTALMQRLDLLTHLTQFGDSVILVSGPDGSGKTTLLSRFLAQSNPQWRLCPIDATSFGQLADRLTDAVGGGSFTTEQEILNHWASESDSSQLLVMVIDNCEQLDQADSDHLGGLLNQPAAERIRLLLFGTPEAQQRIKQTFDRQTPSVTTQLLEVPRLTEEETASYLMYRMAVAGYSGESPFTPTEVRAICKAADGRPADINRMAKASLLERQARARSRQLPLGDSLMRRGGGRTWGLVAAGVLLVVVYLGWQQFSPPPAGSDPPAEVPLAQAELPLALPEPAPPVTAQESAGAARQRTAPEPLSAPVPAQDTAAAAGAAAPPQPAAFGPSPLDSMTSSLEAGIADQRDSAAQALPAPSPQRTAPLPVPAPVADASPPPAPVATGEPAAPLTAVARPSPDTVPTDTAPTDTAAAPTEPAPATRTQAAALEPAASVAGRPHREDWLLQQAKTSYSLQLLGSRSEKSMLDFIRRNRLDEARTAYYRGVHQGAPWYVLMYGVYPTKEAALEGRDRLPARVRGAKPWPRTLDSVHQAIRDAQ